MVRRFLPIAATLAALALAAACEHAPTDPNIDVESILTNTDPSLSSQLKPVASTLPALFREAIARVEKDQGRIGVQSLLSDWRGLQDQLKDGAATADRSAVQAKVEAIHDEELNVVLRGLGPGILTRVMSELNMDLAEAQAQILSGSVVGADSARAVSIANQVNVKIGVARGGIVLNHWKESLDAASQAATLLSGLDFYLIELQRVNGLENLYPRAVDKLKADGHSDVLSTLSGVERASAAAREAVAANDRSAAQTNLAQSRAEQIRVVLKVFGPQVADQLVTDLDLRTTQLKNVISVLVATGQDVTRMQRMLNEANDLAKRAHAARDVGDAATALDLGSHAAGLLNALQHLTWK